MPGYYKNPEATAATVDSEGWLHTGDVGYRDEDGFLFIVDRVKELIKYKGNQVSSSAGLRFDVGQVGGDLMSIFHQSQRYQ